LQQPEDLAAIVAAAQAEIAAAVERAGILHDPYGHVLMAQSRALDVQFALLTGFQETMATAKPPDTGELRKPIETKLAGGQLSREAAELLPWAIDRLVAQRFRRMAIGAAVILVGAVALAIGGTSLWDRYAFNHREIDAVGAINQTLREPSAATWATLMRANADIIDQEQGQCHTDHGGTACVYTLWTALPPPTKGGQ
jgi:hypothetical protein